MTDLEQQAIACSEMQDYVDKLEAVTNDLRERFEAACAGELPNDPRELAAIIKAATEAEKLARGQKYGAMCGLGHALKALGVKP